MRKSGFPAGAIALCGALALFGGAALAAAPAETAAPTAVQLIFERPYMTKVEPGSQLAYSFARKTDDKQLSPSFDDEVKISITKDGEIRTARVELFTGARQQNFTLPNMDGNPLIMVLLEQDVQEMGKITGGNPYYIRNRLREAINGTTTSEPAKVEFGGRTLDGWKLSIRPFANDKMRDRLKEFAERTYEITYADEAPGGLVQLKAVTPRRGGGDPLLTEELLLKSAAKTEKTQ